MKRTRNSVYGLFLLALSLSTALPAMAQHIQHHGTTVNKSDSSRSGMQAMKHGEMKGMMPDGMMPGHMEMMQSMMSDPLHRTMIMARVLPTMGEPLSLSNEQVSRLAELQQAFNKDDRIARAKLASAQQSLHEDLTSSADAEQVRSGLEARASLGADLQVLSYNAALRMLGVLSAEQRAQVENMKPMKLHHHMMSNMTNEEMMETMHGSMMEGVSCPMMSGGMMRDEMRSGMPQSDSN